jgi:hypothetical protein
VNPAYNPSQAASASNLPFLRQQFRGCDGLHPNVICPTDPRLQNSLAQQWFQFLPNPTFPGALNNYLSPVANSDISGAGTDHRQNYDIRIDDYLGQKDHVAVTLHYHDTVFAKVSSSPLKSVTIPASDGGEIGPWVIQATKHTFSPNVSIINYITLTSEQRNSCGCSLCRRFA